MHIKYLFIVVLPCFSHKQKGKSLYELILLIKIMSKCFFRHQLKQIFNFFYTFLKNKFILFIFIFGCVGSSLLRAGFL